MQTYIKWIFFTLAFFLIASIEAQENRRTNELGGVFDHGTNAYVLGSGTSAVQPRRPVEPEKTCVCQYQQTPQNCIRNQSQSSCRRQRDCIWVKEGRLAGACRNWHQHYCETEFQQRPPVGGCRRYTVIPSGAEIPACGANEEDYFYTYHGHGPRIREFIDSAKSIIQRSDRRCNFSFKDQSCQTFAVAGNDQIRDLETVREVINTEVRGLLQGAQTATLTANQIDTPAAVVAPYVIDNPSYSFNFNRNAITSEQPTSCNISITCGSYFQGNFYLCHNGTGIERKLCCNRRWLTNTLRCP